MAQPVIGISFAPKSTLTSRSARRKWIQEQRCIDSVIDLLQKSIPSTGVLMLRAPHQNVQGPSGERALALMELDQQVASRLLSTPDVPFKLTTSLPYNYGESNPLFTLMVGPTITMSGRKKPMTTRRPKLSPGSTTPQSEIDVIKSLPISDTIQAAVARFSPPSKPPAGTRLFQKV